MAMGGEMIWTTYAALLAVLFLVLSIRTLRLRRRLKVAIGDGENTLLLRAIRAHANFAEYAPFGLILIIACETLAAPALLIHVLGMALLIGRLLHAFGVSRQAEVFAFRVSGMASTFACYVLATGFILVRTLSAIV